MPELSPSFINRPTFCLNFLQLLAYLQNPLMSLINFSYGWALAFMILLLSARAMIFYPFVAYSCLHF